MAIITLYHKKTSSVGIIRGRIPTADILALNSTPLNVIPAQGTGFTILIKNISVGLDYNSIAYATNLDLTLEYASGTNILNLANFLNATSDRVRSSTDDTLSINGEANQAVRWFVPVGNPTAGNSDIDFELEYLIMPFS